MFWEILKVKGSPTTADIREVLTESDTVKLATRHVQLFKLLNNVFTAI